MKRSTTIVWLLGLLSLAVLVSLAVLFFRATGFPLAETEIAFVAAMIVVGIFVIDLAVLWEPEKDEIRELPPWPGDTVGGAQAINDRGEVVGASGPTCGPPSPALAVHALLWKNGTATDLGNLGGTAFNSALAINNRGQIAGLSGLSGNTTFHAFLWQNGKMKDLGTLPGDFSSIAFGINDHAQVVGQSCDVNFNCRAFLWQKGVMTDVNTLIAARSSLYLVAAEGINSRGEIVGGAFNQTSGDAPAFLAIPCDRDHIGNEACRPDATQRTDSMSPPSKVILPDTVRKQLRQRLVSTFR